MNRLIVVGFVLLLSVQVNAQEWIEHSVDGDLLWGRAGFPQDIDNDGDIDLIGSYEDAGLPGILVWWENLDRAGTSWIQHDVVVTNEYFINSILSEDIDCDEDMDLISAGSNNLIWWENSNGIGSSWIQHMIDDNNFTEDSNGAATYDIDNDGDMDIVISNLDTYPYGDLRWWENTDGMGLNWIEHVIDEEYVAAIAVNASDIDNDGDLDILAGSGHEDKVAWWENTDGIGIVWLKHTLDQDFYDIPTCIIGSDMDRDGDIDVLSSANHSNLISWWENIDGSGYNWTEHPIENTVIGTRDVSVTDLDHDGDVDVLGAVWDDDKIVWWENTNGIGTEWTEHTVDEWSSPFCVDPADVNGDGYTDIVGASATPSGLSWWEHPVPVDVTLTPLNYPIGIPVTGGPFWYSISLTNYTVGTIQGTFHTEAILPNQNTYGPLLNFDLAVYSGQTLNSPILQVNVPGFAPTGIYEFRAVFSPFVMYPPSSDFFVFEKLVAPVADEVVRSWSFTQWTGEDGSEIAAPIHDGEYALMDVSPNPFNASTMITVTLPQADRLIVTVHNVTGQQVASLANGQCNTGVHRLLLNASNLSSGLYFIHVTVPGHFDQVQKVMLVR